MARRATKIVKDRDLGWALLGKRLRDKSARAVRIAPSGRGDDGLSNAQLGAWLEFGTRNGHIPARPHIRPVFDRNALVYLAIARKLADGVIVGLMDKRKALNLLGLKIVSDVKARIRSGIPPANADSTIAAKGSSTPLIDSGQYVASIKHEVVRR